MKNPTQTTALCKINIADKEAPIFISDNLNNDIHTSSTAMNTIILPSSEYLQFNKYELSLLSNRDVFFLQGVKKSNSLERLLTQAKPYCRVTKIINLYDFININNIDIDKENYDLFDVIKASKLDELSFRNILIYFCNFDSDDMQSAIESYALAEVDIEQIHELLHYHSVDSKIIKNTKDL